VNFLAPVAPIPKGIIQFVALKILVVLLKTETSFARPLVTDLAAQSQFVLTVTELPVIAGSYLLAKEL